MKDTKIQFTQKSLSKFRNFLAEEKTAVKKVANKGGTLELYKRGGYKIM